MRKTTFAVCVSLLCLATSGCSENEDPIPQEAPEGETRSARESPADPKPTDTSEAVPVSDGKAATLTASGYDRERARRYVERYAKDPNPNFDYCGNWGWNAESGRLEKQGADCTSFASQVLWYGGLLQRKSSSEDDGWWSTGGCRAWSSSKSWRQVNRLVNYLLSESRQGQIVTDERQLEIGDVIFYQLREEKNGYACPQELLYNHTTVVSGFDERGEPLVSYHSNDARDVPWLAKSGSQGSLGNACHVLLIHIR